MLVGILLGLNRNALAYQCVRFETCEGDDDDHRTDPPQTKLKLFSFVPKFFLARALACEDHLMAKTLLGSN